MARGARGENGPTGYVVFPFEVRPASDIRAEAQKIKPQRPFVAAMSSGDELAHDLGGIIHHRDHPCVIEPRQADHAENADDAAGALAVRRDDGGGAPEREELGLRADKDMGALGALGPPEKTA